MEYVKGLDLDRFLQKEAVSSSFNSIGVHIENAFFLWIIKLKEN